MSAEDLSFAGPGTVEKIRHDLGTIPIRVVVTLRPLSQAIVSAYGEWSKKNRVPDADHVVRAVLVDLLRDRAQSRYAWLVVQHVREIWRPVVTDGWHEVELNARSIEDFQQSFWLALGIEGLRPPPPPRKNQGLPAGAVIAWQEALRLERTFDARVDGGTIAALLTYNSSHPEAPRSKLQLRADVGGARRRSLRHHS